jgi:5-methylcytosine-specific restriction protein B
MVHRGIDPMTISSPVINTNGHVVHAWPVPEADHVDPTSINNGDFVLFYRGSNRYTWAARVRRINSSRELTEQLTSPVVEQAGPNTQPSHEFSGTILWLDIPIPIELESYRLHDLLDIDQEALTRTITPQSDALNSVYDEHGSVEEMLRTVRKSPSVYIELTSIENKPCKQPDGEFPLGTAVFSRSESADGRDIYSTLREPEVGDLVLHVLKDTREVRGISTVASILQTDFEAPPNDSREPEARGEGYFLLLGHYREFDDTIDIDIDLLENEDYRERLQTISEEHDNLVYDKNFELDQDA